MDSVWPAPVLVAAYASSRHSFRFGTLWMISARIDRCECLVPRTHNAERQSHGNQLLADTMDSEHRSNNLSPLSHCDLISSVSLPPDSLVSQRFHCFLSGSGATVEHDNQNMEIHGDMRGHLPLYILLFTDILLSISTNHLSTTWTTSTLSTTLI